MNIDTLKISGPLIERTRASYPPSRPRKKMTEEEKRKRHEIKAQYNAGLEIPDMEKLAPSFSRARGRIRRIMNANSWQWRDKRSVPIPPRFLTLTFGENIQDLSEANRFFSEFMQWLNYEFRDIVIGKIQYICVPEFQKRGAIHYHVIIFNFPFVDKGVQRIRKRWKDRFELRTLNKNRSVSAMVAYISKYITKQAIDGRFFGQKRFFPSKGLKKTITSKDAIANELICQKLEFFGVQKMERQIDLPFVGNLLYTMYYLGDGGRLNLKLLDEYSRNQLKLAEGQKK